MKNNNYITILGWMVNELSLSGNDLICYAVIYGFSQDDKFWDGSQSYLSDWLGVSRRAVVDILKRLISNGLISKQEYEINNVKFCKYKAIVPNTICCEDSAQGRYEDSSHDNKNNIKKEKEDKSSFQKERLDYDEILAKWKEICPNLSQPRMLDDKRKKAIRELLKNNNATIEDLYKAFQMISISSHCNAKTERNKTWKATLNWLINDTKGCFNRLLEGEFACTQSERELAEKIKKGEWKNEDSIKATYHPFGNNNIMWNDLYNCWLSIDDFNGSVIDGYNDENRPDGAEIVLHNARGTITWSKKNKKWNIEMKSPW